MNKELIVKISIIITVFLLVFTTFKLLQQKAIFENTLGIFTYTYENISKNKAVISDKTIEKTNNSFTAIKDSNFIHWDVAFYKYMSEKTYGQDNTWPGVGTYAFSPLFPFIWKISHLNVSYIPILNYLLFALSILILSSLFLAKTEFNLFDKICLFTLALTLPSIFSFYLPYCESTYLFTFSIAIWSLFKNKYWVFFIAMIAFTLSRPSFLIFSLAFICTDVYFLILNRNLKIFVKELALKLPPIFIGIFLTLYIQYLNCGEFFKMFEVHSKFWEHSDVSLPTSLSDWSIEGYGMSIFAICCLVLPSILLLFNKFIKIFKDSKNNSISIFNSETRTEYLFVLSIIYFWGKFSFVLLTQDGNLNGLHRYIFASPFFYIFFFIFIQKIRTYDFKYVAVIMASLMFIGYLFLEHGPFQHDITFLDMGYFLFILSTLYYLGFNFIKSNKLKLSLLILIIVFNITWLCFLYNGFFNNCYITV